MPETQAAPLADYLAEQIHDQAGVLVEEWITWITQVVVLRPARRLPRAAIRDHIPAVIRGIADSLRGPSEAVGPAFAALKTHARVRHDQGYDVEELVQEYRGLSRIVGRRMIQALESYPGEPDPVEVARVFLRLSEGMSMVSSLTVSVYRSTEVDQKRELHRQLEDYVRTVTHELKQPLNAVLAGAGMLEMEGVATQDDQRRRYVEMIRSGIDRSSRLIDDIRALVLYEGAQQHVDWQPLRAAVDLVVDELRGFASSRRVRIDVEGELPPVRVDATRAEIALVNLVSNGIKYADPDESDRWVRIGTRPVSGDPSRWEVWVADNGLGIPEHVHTQIFERHFRAHPHVDEGTGLGLAIARRVVEQVGGSIWFDSEPGAGSVFHFVLPVTSDEPPEDMDPVPAREDGDRRATGHERGSERVPPERASDGE